jgi:hypothetical protein
MDDCMRMRLFIDGNLGSVKTSIMLRNIVIYERPVSYGKLQAHIILG